MGMNEIQTLEKTGVSILLETPEGESSTALVLLPGISAGVFSERFNGVRDACMTQRISLCRVEGWSGAEDVSKKSYAQLHLVLDEVLAFLTSKGFSHYICIGKSFGGGVILSYPKLSVFGKAVLWAPAIGAADSAGTFHGHRDTLLGEASHVISKLLDITLDSACLSETAKGTDVCIIHGTADAIVPLSNSDHLVHLLPRARLETIEGADHSFRTPEHEKALLDMTFQFLNHTY